LSRDRADQIGQNAKRTSRHSGSTMKTVLLSYFSAARSLTQRGVLWHLMWPTLAAAAVWTSLLVSSWSSLVEVGNRLITGMPLVGGWLAASETALLVALVMFKIGLVVLALPIIYVTAAFLVAAVALPLMAEKVAATDYADIARRRGGSQMGSVWNALVSVLQFLLLLVLSLPLWLIPGAGLILSLVLTAWLNQRAFRYDALMAHADAFEMKDLPARQPAACSGWGCWARCWPTCPSSTCLRRPLRAGLRALPAVCPAGESANREHHRGEMNG
jgi:hypothetical protein